MPKPRKLTPDAYARAATPLRMTAAGAWLAPVISSLTAISASLTAVTLHVTSVSASVTAVSLNLTGVR